ncbi:serine O-acetyltransferase [Algoriphagus sp. Y33]|uniref:serine O-acetyltransferase n=1 Tax=Algoriphagus sp. Y33 TaxID=2772483 RepID=UPI00177F785F|nr:hypothetical protein [Algoriphagus sp. Y33]
MITLKQTIQAIKDDLPKKSFKTFLRCYFYSAGFRVLLNHRIGKYLFYNRFILSRQMALYYKYKLVSKRGCDISYKAQIGKCVRFPHAIGIVIGDGVIIGNNVKIWQQVTFGSHGKLGEKLEYPIVKDNVKIFAGAKIIGGLTIGECSVIGASSLINKDVPANSVAYGIPFKIKGQ